MSQKTATRRNRISLATEAGVKGSPLGWIASASLHVMIVAATLFSWTHRLDIADESPPVVPVDLITIGEKTNIAPTVKEEPRIEPKDEFAALEPDQPPPPELPDEVEPAPQETLSQPVILKPPKPATPKPREQTEKKKSSQDDFAALLNKLTSQPKAPANARRADRTIKGIGAQNAMTMDLVDALRNQIAQCWSPPAASPHPERLIVTVRMFLNPDGGIAQPPQLSADSRAAAGGDPFMRAAADAAMRAVYVCGPYKLPPDRYSQWRDIEVTFDPRKMAGLE